MSLPFLATLVFADMEMEVWKVMYGMSCRVKVRVRAHG